MDIEIAEQEIQQLSAMISKVKASATSQGRSLNAEESGIIGEMESHIKTLTKSLPQAALTVQGFGGRNLDPSGTLNFETREGEKVKAYSLKHKMTDMTPKDIADQEIGPGSLGRILRSKILGDPTGLNRSEIRAFGESTGGLGGFFVPASVSSYVIDLARANSCAVKAGMWTLPMDGPDLTLVKILTDPTSHWVSEHAAITESDGTFGPIVLKAVTLGSLVRVSTALLEDSPDSGRTIEAMLAASIGLEIDRAALLGDGVNGPKGLFSCADVNVYSMGVNGAAATNYDPFSHACQSVLEANGIATAAIMAPRTFGGLDRLKEGGTNSPLGAPASYEALNKFYTTQVPIDQTQGTSDVASCAFVGDFTNLVLGVRKQITLDIERAGDADSFAKLDVLIRAHIRADIAILRENHFTIVKGLL